MTSRREREVARLGLLLLVCVFSGVAGSGNGLAAPVQFGTGACQAQVDDPNAYAIIHEVFDVKSDELARAGLLSGDFWAKNRDLGFAICNNKGSYDAFVVYGKGVVFDYQMVKFLFAQSRALMLGRYISLDSQFDVHAELVTKFANQGPSSEADPFEIVKQGALARGMSESKLKGTFSDPMFEKREQTLSLVTMYFLTMHERCHVALDHGPKLAEIKKLPELEKSLQMQGLEVDADRCALDIINADEAQFKGSPISLLGVLVIVATQAIVSARPSLRSERSHPSTRARLSLAKDRVMEFIGRPKTEAAERYAATIAGTAEYFDALLARLEIRP